MNIFLVSPTRSGDVIRRRAVDLVRDENIMDVGNGSFFVATNDPTPIDQMKTALGLTGRADGGSGVIVKIANYSGYANKAIGDWLEAKSD